MTIPIENAVHLCVDMQRIFAKGGIWETPWMERVLPTIVDIVGRCPERTVFTRFITPASPEEAAGQWRPYFERWRTATRNASGGTQLDLVPELARFAPPAAVVDRPTYSAFFRSPLANFLREIGIRTVIVSGAETDVCVLSTRARCRKYRLSRGHRGGRTLQLVGSRARRADDNVPVKVQRADRSRHRRRPKRNLAAGAGGVRNQVLRSHVVRPHASGKSRESADG